MIRLHLYYCIFVFSIKVYSSQPKMSVAKNLLNNNDFDRKACSIAMEHLTHVIGKSVFFNLYKMFNAA